MLEYFLAPGTPLARLEAVELIGGIAVVVAFLGFTWYLYYLGEQQKREEEEKRAAERAAAEKEAQALARAKVAARQKFLADFQQFVTHPANQAAMLDDTWRTKFDWDAVVSAAKEESIDIVWITALAFFAALQDPRRQSTQVTVERQAAASLWIRLVAERGPTRVLEDVVRWCLKRCPGIIDRVKQELVAKINSINHWFDNIAEWYWLTDKTGNPEDMDRARRDRETAEKSLRAIEEVLARP